MGESQAKVKGSVMVGVVKFLRTRREEALEELPEHLHHYLQERVWAASWYPEEDLVTLLRVLAKLFGQSQPGTDIYEVIGTITANQHLTGIYEHMAKQKDVSALPLHLSTLWETQHDTGRLRVVRQGPRKMLLEIADYGHPTKEMCRIITAYARECYQTVGIENPQVTKTTCRMRGDPSCTWNITWTEADGPDPGN